MYAHQNACCLGGRVEREILHEPVRGSGILKYILVNQVLPQTGEIWTDGWRFVLNSGCAGPDDELLRLCGFVTPRLNAFPFSIQA